MAQIKNCWDALLVLQLVLAGCHPVSFVDLYRFRWYNVAVPRSLPGVLREVSLSAALTLAAFSYFFATLLLMLTE